MKKFVFSLHVLEHHKQTIEKKQKSDLSRIIGVIHTLEGQKRAVNLALEQTAASLEDVLKHNRDIVAEMERHNNYTLFCRDQLKQLERKLVKAETEKKAIQDKLIITMKELKALARLRETEFNAYLEEIRKDEEKVLNDLISHNSAVGEES